MEGLTRGLVAAQTADGIFLSWRFLGDEPDGISWNVYRKDGDAGLREDHHHRAARRPARERLRVEPRRREGERDAVQLHRSRRLADLGLRGRPGARRRRGRPAGRERADALGPARSGRAGEPRCRALHPDEAGPGARAARPLHLPRPALRPRHQPEPGDMVIPGTGGQHWYVVDMDLLRAFREPHDEQTPVTAARPRRLGRRAQRAQRGEAGSPTSPSGAGGTSRRRAVRRARGEVHRLRREARQRHHAALCEDRRRRDLHVAERALLDP